MKKPLNILLVVALLVVLAVHCNKSNAGEREKLPACLGDNTVFVNDVIVSNNGVLHESSRVGTCDKGDPINVMIVEKQVIVEKVKIIKPEPRRLRPKTGGEYEYTASLKITY